ncbi:hypothetical protein QJS10_CPA07g00880 [Acorus calamus]|uniref:Uncharacterized protein n=1 Tax=Acorus calamus TaxID=4465 RepID=A0AAV9EG58_ACOCL|nr:hypothetical protein QJS10_CPA07g00880 [Acorus calamus]
MSVWEKNLRVWGFIGDSDPRPGEGRLVITSRPRWGGYFLAALIGELENLLDMVEMLVVEKEERVTKSLLELPIWGSPRDFVVALANGEEMFCFLAVHYYHPHITCVLLEGFRLLATCARLRVA